MNHQRPQSSPDRKHPVLTLNVAGRFFSTKKCLVKITYHERFAYHTRIANETKDTPDPSTGICADDTRQEHLARLAGAQCQPIEDLSHLGSNLDRRLPSKQVRHQCCHHTRMTGQRDARADEVKDPVDTVRVFAEVKRVEANWKR